MMDQERIDKVDSFEQLMNLKWGHQMTANAHRTLRDLKKNKITILPLSQDVKALSDFLKKGIRKHGEALAKNNSNVDDYNALKKMLLTAIILFNRRRSGETSRMTLDEYYGKDSGEPEGFSEEMGLSSLEKALAGSLKRIEITGKRGRTVPVLLPALMANALDLMVSCREKVGVSSDNSYVFNNNTDSGCIRGSDVLREYSEICGAKKPESLRSTKLRKHIATISQVVNLNENELDILASFMGHDIKTHREYYRLPEETTQLAKVSKLLHALDSGTISSIAGKSLDQIQINMDEELNGKVSFILNQENCSDGL